MAAVQVYTEPGSDATWAEMMFITVLVAPPYILGRLVRKFAEQGQQLESSKNSCGAKPSAPSGTASPASYMTSLRIRSAPW